VPLTVVISFLLLGIEEIGGERLQLGVRGRPPVGGQAEAGGHAAARVALPGCG
jgi:hypothetical protein